MQITPNMTRDELRKLRPKKAKTVTLTTEGKTHTYPATDVEDFVGISGDITFK